MAVRDLIIRIGGDSQELRQALDAGGKALKGFGIAGAAAAAAVTAAAVATAAVVAAVVADTLRLVEVAKEINTNARIAGASAQEFQVVAGALASVHIEGFDVANTFNELKIKAGDAAAGNLALQKAFKDLGIEASEFVNLPIPEQFAKLADGLVAVQNPMDRVYILNMLISDAGKKMIPLLEQGGDAVRGMMDEIEQAGTLTNHFAAASGLLAKEIGLLDRTAQSARGTLEEELLPSITGTTKGIRELLANARDTGELMRLGEALNAFYLKSVVPAIGAAMAATEEFLYLLGTIPPLVALLAKLQEIVATLSSPTGLLLGAADLKRNITEAREALGEFGKVLRGVDDGFARATTRAGQFVETIIRAAAEAAAAGNSAPPKSPPPPPKAGGAGGTATPVASGVGSDFSGVASRVASDILGGEQGFQIKLGFDLSGMRESMLFVLDTAVEMNEAVREESAKTQALLDQYAEQDKQRALDVAAAQKASAMEVFRASASLFDRAAAAAIDAEMKRGKASKKEQGDAFERMQGLATLQAIINGAVGITNIWATWAAVPVVAGILTGIEAAAIAVQLGTIANQESPFHSGGLVGRGLASRNANLANGININALPGEAVINRGAVDDLGGERGVRALNQRRGGLGGSTQVAYLTYDGRVLGTVVNDMRAQGADPFRVSPPVGRVNHYARRVT